jgi:diguanylate cyclase (GGDEF)-like protein
VEEVKKAQRYDLSLAIIMLTVDDYKQINDTHDYLLAERILRDLSQAIRRHLREVDLLGRYGGESFLVVLPNTDQGHHCVQRIHSAAQELTWEYGEEKVTITISAGMAQLEKHTPAELIATAEKRLELAKSLGGNRIVVAGEDEI